MGAPSIDPAARQLIWRLVRDAAVDAFHPVLQNLQTVVVGYI
jgi:hypothetical protein